MNILLSDFFVVRGSFQLLKAVMVLKADLLAILFHCNSNWIQQTIERCLDDIAICGEQFSRVKPALFGARYRSLRDQLQVTSKYEKSKTVCKGFHPHLSVLARCWHPLRLIVHEQSDEFLRYRLVCTVRHNRKCTRKAVARRSQATEVDQLQSQALLYRSHSRVGRRRRTGDFTASI